MLTQEITEQIEDGEFPDNMDFNAAWHTFAGPETVELDIPDEIWAEALDWADIINVIRDPGYDYEIPGMGKCEQDVCIDFTAGLSPTGDIMFEAVMYKAKITKKETVTYRDQELCKAFILWKPESQLTDECIKHFIRKNC